MNAPFVLRLFSRRCLIVSLVFALLSLGIAFSLFGIAHGHFKLLAFLLAPVAIAVRVIDIPEEALWQTGLYIFVVQFITAYLTCFLIAHLWRWFKSKKQEAEKP